MTGGVLQPVSLSITYKHAPILTVCNLEHALCVQVVHKAVHRSQRDLLALLWSEYNGKKISPFESYRCRKDTTEEDLSLFFSRMQKFKYVGECFCLDFFISLGNSI